MLNAAAAAAALVRNYFWTMTERSACTNVYAGICTGSQLLLLLLLLWDPSTTLNK